MAELLKVEGLKAGYGESVVLNGIDLELPAGESLALLGRNGTGKTTLLNTLVGVTRRHAGRISLAGRDITALAPYQRADTGIGWVPQERNIFKSLTVEENLTAVARPWMGLPAKRTSPVVGTRPQTARSVVVLPAPLAPSSVVIVPSSRLKLMPCKTGVGP